MDKLDQIKLQDLLIQCRFKKELCDLLTYDWELYLPPIPYANGQFIRDVVTGQKKISPQENILCW